MNSQKVKTPLFILLSILVLSCQSDVIEEAPDVVAVVDIEYDLGWLINHYMIYPKSESDVNRVGIVDLSWIVTKEGTVKDVEAFVRTTNEPAESAIARRRIKDKEELKINQPILDNLIYSVALLKFTPALKDEKPVSSRMTTSIEFVLI
ncbi:hypothetical protein [Dokdonia sp.]|uniref:hypothetical protein n=1 Tax=Dokdonia sp. TaxID=2024995 RepID=UPI003267C8DB